MRHQILRRKRPWLFTTESDFKSCSWTTWKPMTGENRLAHTAEVLLSMMDYTVRVLGALTGLDGPAKPPLGPPLTVPAQRLHFSSALGLQSLPSYAVHVFVSSSVPAKPLPGHEPCWSPAHGPISWPDSGPASSPQTCLTVAVPCLSILSRSPKTDFQRVTQEEQAKKCTKRQHATYINMSVWDLIRFDQSPSVNSEMEVWDISIGQPQKNPVLYIVEIKKVTKQGLIKCGMDKSANV